MVAENNIGKRQKVVWASKRFCNVYIAKAFYRFLEDKNSQISNMQLDCLDVKVQSGTSLEDTAPHCPDIQMFSLSDIVCHSSKK